jgi:hypothetical protein
MVKVSKSAGCAAVAAVLLLAPVFLVAIAAAVQLWFPQTTPKPAAVAEAEPASVQTNAANDGSGPPVSEPVQDFIDALPVDPAPLDNAPGRVNELAAILAASVRITKLANDLPPETDEAARGANAREYRQALNAMRDASNELPTAARIAAAELLTLHGLQREAAENGNAADLAAINAKLQSLGDSHRAAIAGE